MRVRRATTPPELAAAWIERAWHFSNRTPDVLSKSLPCARSVQL
jgi:hypothetical protein